MNRLMERIGLKLGHLFDCALIKPLPWQIIDAHEKLREVDKNLQDDDGKDQEVIEVVDPDIHSHALHLRERQE